ncbi:hypothetical protein E3C22_19525 [Jiella endophytica]|uniref:Serine protease n=1 Tax=Jiella endophytica TaxID=2558362 RepID=A0A4Y8RDF6_9HYPH|nr:hypothetical protein [Jiella endophytica]TFF19857.1 hypothetical protein E3C22_19525 [Jiella endophytica]
MTSGNSPLYDSARKRVALSTAGFLTIGSGLDDVGESLGSGSLARIGSASGVVTAAHVLEALSRHERVGIVHFARPEGREQRAILTTNHCGDVAFRKLPWQQRGPDLAFVKLPPYVVGSLEAQGCVFIDLDSRKESILKNGYQPQGFWFVAGVVAERSGVAEKDDKKVTVSVEAAVEPGDVSDFPLDEGFDGYCFVPGQDPLYVPPSSYEGMSGGGLWIGHTTDGEGAAGECSSLSFVGVNFWQSDVGEQGRSIVCHGPNGIYKRLSDAVHAKFP